MRDANSRLVYSTGGEVPNAPTAREKPAKHSAATPSRGGVRLRLDRRASDRLMTLVSGLPGTEKTLQQMLRGEAACVAAVAEGLRLECRSISATSGASSKPRDRVQRAGGLTLSQGLTPQDYIVRAAAPASAVRGASLAGLGAAWRSWPSPRAPEETSEEILGAADRGGRPAHPRLAAVPPIRQVKRSGPRQSLINNAAETSCAPPRALRHGFDSVVRIVLYGSFLARAIWPPADRAQAEGRSFDLTITARRSAFVLPSSTARRGCSR